MIGFIGTSLQLQSIITAHNQWLSKTRSIPCWTTSVFCSAWLTWLSFTSRSLLQLPSSALANNPQLNTELLTLTTELRLTWTMSVWWINLRCSHTFVDSVDEESALRTKSVSMNPHLHRNVLASRCLAMYYSGFQASCHNLVLLLLYTSTPNTEKCVYTERDVLCYLVDYLDQRNIQSRL
jgi:hypothetical protein